MTMITTADWLGRFLAVERTIAFPDVFEIFYSYFYVRFLYLFIITRAMWRRYAIKHDIENGLLLKK